LPYEPTVISPNQRARVLVIDDEPGIRETLRIGLVSHGYTVTESDRGMTALEAVRRNDTDLILLDLNLPDFHGLDIIKRIRYAQSTIPIIVLSVRGDEAAKVSALDLGADDFVTKPFSCDELLARIRVLERYRIQQPSAEKIIKAGPLIVNRMERSATIRGTDVKFSPREYTLVRLFAMHPGRVLTHGFILRNVWGDETDIRYLRIYIRSIRQKLELNPDNPRLILTEPGVGYRLATASAAQ
jgi:two-component system, OmpR family, KDP operon response regulator KdpE